MSSNMDRLRRLHGLRRQRAGAEPKTLPNSITGLAAELPPGEVLGNSAGECYVVTQHYALSEERGSRPLGALLHQDPAAAATFHPNFAIPRRADFLDAAFIDTETTGLGAGAGVYAFMVGVGFFESLPAAVSAESPGFRFTVRQFFMRNPAEEGALLVALADLLSRFQITVTFNGRTFDLPLLRTRYRQNRWALPVDQETIGLLEADRPHLDLLHPARRLWRRRLQSCRLINLEDKILGLQRSEDDVPGHLIPQLYAEYTRDGDAAQVNRVFYHNREDIVSMVSLAERLARVHGMALDDLDETDLVDADWTSLGQSYERHGDPAAAEIAYRRALDMVAGPALTDAFQRLAQLQKRQKRWAEATEIWQRWITTVPGNDATPYVELAKYCEWHAKDLEQAEMWTSWALHNLRSSTARQRDGEQVEALEHRLARIRGKLRADEA